MSPSDHSASGAAPSASYFAGWPVNYLLHRHKDDRWHVRQIFFDDASRTRRAVLEPYIRDVLTATTLGELVKRLNRAGERLQHLDILSDVKVLLDTPSQWPEAAGQPGVLDVHIRFKELSRVRMETGTQVGNAEGNVHASLLVRDVFGRAETFQASTLFGTKTHSSFEAILSKPMIPAPGRLLQLHAHQLHKSFQATSSYDELSRVAGARLVLPHFLLGSHTLGYSAHWRQVLNVGENASLSVRHEAGHSLKSAVTHKWVADSRDSAVMPTSGALFKLESEYAGLGGDVNHAKSELEAQVNVPLGRGFSISKTLRVGAVVPFENDVPRITDRLFVGGSTSVRGFLHNGIGPKDGADALGGTIAYQAGVSLFTPMPGLADKKWLRGHLWANAGSAMQIVDFTEAKLRAFVEATPSIAVGAGVAVHHPQCRLEFNWGLPLVARRGDAVKPGFQFGIGISFL
ncbi:hypothetical protein GGF31_004277 [Allomyces arbusculus]|nr:hypothetical protein GGF31_004277 [Allomyces arbusculus]